MFGHNIFLQSPTVWVELATNPFSLDDVLLIKMTPTQTRFGTEAFLQHHLFPLLKKILWRTEKSWWPIFQTVSSYATTDEATFVDHFRDDAIKETPPTF